MSTDATEGQLASFGIIAVAGEARSLSFRALRAAKAGDFAQADELMEQAKKAGIDAHQKQTDMLVQEANGNHVEVDVLLVHAQDHLMTSMLAQELIVEMIELHKQVAALAAREGGADEQNAAE